MKVSSNLMSFLPSFLDLCFGHFALPRVCFGVAFDHVSVVLSRAKNATQQDIGEARCVETLDV
jgi:hypothetical protein